MTDGQTNRLMEWMKTIYPFGILRMLEYNKEEKLHYEKLGHYTFFELKKAHNSHNDWWIYR